MVGEEGGEKAVGCHFKRARQWIWIESGKALSQVIMFYLWSMSDIHPPLPHGWLLGVMRNGITTALTYVSTLPRVAQNQFGGKMQLQSNYKISSM